MSFSQSAQIQVLLKDVKEQLSKRGGVMQIFHSMDKDQSNQLSTQEFAAALKECGILLPPHQLRAFVACFDANGDGSVSIPEFSAFMMGRTDTFDSLRSAASVATTPSRVGTAPAAQQRSELYASYSQPRSLQSVGSETASEFLARMTCDIEDRRKYAFVNELKKDPRFRPSMLEPPKSKLKQVRLEGGPIFKSVNSSSTGLTPRKAYKWGQLGSFY